MRELFKRKHKWLKNNWFTRTFLRGRARFYRMSRSHIALGIFLGMIMVLLIVASIMFFLYHPSVMNIINQPLPERIELDLNNPPLAYNFTASVDYFSNDEAIELKINLHNDGQIPISDIKINFSTLDKNFLINQIDLVSDNIESGIVMNNKKLLINSLGADENKEIAIKVYFKNNNLAARTVNWQAQTEYTIRKQVVKELIDLPNLYLKAELQAQAVIYYNSPQGDMLGTGPLPPLAGLPTDYWAFFDVKSSGEFKDLVFSAKLPTGVELTGARSLLAGDFSYNASSRQIIWKIPELKNQGDNYRIGFEIQFIPNEQQVGSSATLLNNIQCYALDTLTNSEKTLRLQDLSTNLDFDKINKGSGVIGLP